VEEYLVEVFEIPTGWGLLVRKGENLLLVRRPAWQDIPVEEQVIFLQRKAARKTPEIRCHA
jgi:hypothetical protein